MSKLLKTLKRLLCPNIALHCILIAFSAAGLIYSLAFGNDASPIAYVVYTVSAYTMAASVLRVIPLIKKGRQLLYNNPYASRYIIDREMRTVISLSISTLMNILYALFRITSGAIYRSVWSVAVGGYYIILSVIRIILMKDVKDIYIKKQSGKQLDECWRSYRLCGILMFLLNCGMVGMVFQMIWQNKSYNYPGMMIYISAMYTFYSFTMAIVNIIRFRRLNNPILSGAKMINFAGALMSLFALQTAMFMQFGGTDEYRQLMNVITGGSVCFIVIVEAVFMIIQSNIKIKNLREEDSNGK